MAPRDWENTVPPAVDKAPLRGDPRANGSGIRNLVRYEVRKVNWLDKPIWQQNCFELLAGKKGVCKGTYLAGLSARCTVGELYDVPKRVLVVTSEDSIELDFLPRFLAADGDPSLVEVVVKDFLIPRDHDWLEQTARDLGDVGLIIIDPVGNHIGASNTDTESGIRPAIAPFNDMADRLHCLIIGVRHLNKDASSGALQSIMGGSAWVNVPRAVIVMARDDEDPMTFHYQVVAGNRGPIAVPARKLLLEIVPNVGIAEDITRTVELGASDKDVEQLLSIRERQEKSPTKSAEARALILDVLEDEGEQESDSLDARIASITGLSARTVRDVRLRLGKEGLTKARKSTDVDGNARWFVVRTNAPRFNH